jgi:hypothetical protein
MLDETARRRPDFREGTTVRLADGQDWVFPDPVRASHGASRAGSAAAAFGPEYVEILSGLDEVQGDEPEEILRAELALAIALLSRNYTLRGDEFLELLGRTPADPALRPVYEAIHAVAVDHLCASRGNGARAV